MLRSVSSAPPAIKGLLLLVAVALFFSLVLYAQTVKAAEASDSPAEPEVTVENKEAPAEESGGILPQWGFCFGEESCSKLADKLASDLREKMDELEVREAHLMDMRADLETREQQLLKSRSEFVLTHDQVRGVATKLVTCASNAMEVLDEFEEPSG